MGNGTIQAKSLPGGLTGLGALLLLGLLAGIPILLDPEESYLVYFLFMTYIYMTLATSWNLVAGYAGQASFGQHAFFGLGAYLMALAWKGGIAGFLDPRAFLISGAGAAFLALLIGLPLLNKLRGDYFALGTLGLAEILRVLFTQGGELTGGPVGLMLPSSAYGSLRPYYWIALATALASLWMVKGVMGSRIGLALVAIREDEQAAAANGIHVLGYKLLAFALGALFTGVCGGLYGYYLFHIHPMGFFSLNWGLLPVLMTLLGGVGTLAGPIVGALLLSGAFELASLYIPEIHPIFSGAFIILVTLFLPRGIMNLDWKGWRDRLFVKKEQVRQEGR